MKQVSPFAKAWAKWKALPLPWRKHVLTGVDLEGNTYWEFRDARGVHPTRPRRIVKYPSGTHHGDVAVPPAWHQWLRHTRTAPPSLDEQRGELARQARMRTLAAAADARWAEARALEESKGQRVGILQKQQSSSAAVEGGETTRATSHNMSEGFDGTGDQAMYAASNRATSWRKLQADEKRRQNNTSTSSPDPWKRARSSGPSEEWQPEGWNPSATPKQR